MLVAASKAYPDDYGITDSLSKLGQLNIRIPYYLFAQKPGKELQDYQKWASMIDINHQPGEVQPVEYFVEGGGESLVIAGGDFENFLKPRPELSLAMDKQLRDVLTVLIKNRWPFRLHATYNESVSRFLNVIEEVNKQYPIRGLPWLFDHVETVSEENLRRIKALEGGISIQNRMAFQGEAFVKRYGKDPALNTPPIRSMLDMKIQVGAGTDGTRVSSYNPWISLYWLVTGKTVGGMQHAADSNKLDRTTALKLFTQGSASLINQDKEFGKIKAGMLADFAILSADYLTVDAEEIKGITAQLTVLNGKVVYANGLFKSMSPAQERQFRHGRR
jgi:predicted amidohydrolase YtcJ